MITRTSQSRMLLIWHVWGWMSKQSNPVILFVAGNEGGRTASSNDITYGPIHTDNSNDIIYGILVRCLYSVSTHIISPTIQLLHVFMWLTHTDLNHRSVGVTIITCVTQIFVNLLPWCSGYHVCLTRTRSPVRSRAVTACFAYIIISFVYIFYM